MKPKCDILLSSFAFKFILRRYTTYVFGGARPVFKQAGRCSLILCNTKLKPSGSMRLKLKCDIRELLSTSALKFNLRRYNQVSDIDFLRAVNIGDLLRFKAVVLHCEVAPCGRPIVHVEVEVGAETRPLLSST